MRRGSWALVMANKWKVKVEVREDKPKDSQKESQKDSQKDKPKDMLPPEPLPMGMAYRYQPGNNYWYAPITPSFPPGQVIWNAATGTYYTVYPATRPVIVLTPHGPVCATVPTCPVVVGPTWALAPVACNCWAATRIGIARRSDPPISWALVALPLSPLRIPFSSSSRERLAAL